MASTTPKRRKRRIPDFPANLDIVISIPRSRGQRSKPKKLVEWLSSLLEDKLTEIDGNPSLGDRDTLAATLGIDDFVFTVTCRGHMEEVTL